MKFAFLFTIILFSTADAFGAAISASPGGGAVGRAPAVSYSENAGVKRGFLERIAEKTFHKRLKKIAKARGRSGDSDGKWLAISGLALGVLAVFSFVFIYYVNVVFLPLVLSAAGLLLSILGLIKASGWEDTRWIRILAIIGIVINALAIPIAIAVI